MSFSHFRQILDLLPLTVDNPLPIRDKRSYIPSDPSYQNNEHWADRQACGAWGGDCCIHPLLVALGSIATDTCFRVAVWVDSKALILFNIATLIELFV